MTTKTSKAFNSWRRRLGLTQTEAAKALGMGRNTVAVYDLGKRWDGEGDIPRDIEVPLVVLLACTAVEQNLQPVR